MKLTIDGHSFEVELTAEGVSVDGRPFTVRVDGLGSTRIATVNGRPVRVDLRDAAEQTATALVEGRSYTVAISGRTAARPAPRPAARDAGTTPVAVRGAVTAQMNGRIVRVAVEPGATVAQGDLLLVLEAMKMENEVRSPRDGIVKEVRVSPGDRVNHGDPLVVFDA
ncbi:MAG: biotin/lipoyl-containing protein [Dehalococcoidia bacterium]